MSSDAERVGLYMQDKHPIRENMEYVKYAEEQGFDEVWQAESRLARDAITPCAAYAAVTVSPGDVRRLRRRLVRRAEGRPPEDRRVPAWTEWL